MIATITYLINRKSFLDFGCYGTGWFAFRILEDDLSCLFEDPFDAHSLLSRQGLRVFDFHPIHFS